MSYSTVNVSFISSIEHELTNSMMESLDILISSQTEFKFFMDNYWNGSDNAFFAISSYRLAKIKQLNMTSLQFIVHYTVDKQDALQELFQSPVSEKHVKLLERGLHRGNITLCELFERHKSNPALQLIRLVND